MTTSPRASALALAFWVGAGAVAGGLARALLGSWFGSGLGLPSELATLFVNLTGSFAIGLWSALTGPDGRLLVGTRRRQFVATGLCGGYTTFSLFSFETIELWRGGAPLLAAGYASATLLGALVAVWAGYASGLWLSRPRGARAATRG
ncbi:MAG: CrcB family protein [Geminicoccaceae bacterium]|nr:CrcB family protein [Geminicoccaceae bacterium]MCX7629470.1 CrcB family protein [Geminicoccaceae bacterium]MDW8124301.1 CrcB family protein [Geminicoccaceae bacterium]